MKTLENHTDHLSSFSSLISSYQNAIDEKLKMCLERMGDRTPLLEACEYALMSGGKRFRPSLAVMVAKALGFGLDVYEAALAVEFFHTASLVVDDLPSMDNDDERREKPSLHKVYGETMALLVSYALIAEGYHALARNTHVLKRAYSPASSHGDRVGILALENAAQNTGIAGATGGQFLDIFPPDLSPDTLRSIIYKKTISLFEIAFVSGWLFGGGEIDKLERVKKAAYNFGMAFQIVDDFDDVAQDKINKRSINIVSALGHDTALKMLYDEINQFHLNLKGLNIDSSELVALAQILIQKASN